MAVPCRRIFCHGEVLPADVGRFRMNYKKALKYLYYRAVRIHGKPREVAMGMAIGLAVGMTPTMGVQMLIAVAISSLAGQSKIAAVVGAWITNPVTFIPLYSATYALGAVVMGRPLVPDEGLETLITSPKLIFSDILLPCWVGGLISAVPIAILGFWISYQAVIAYRLRVAKRRQKMRHHWKFTVEHGWQRQEREQ